MNTAHAISALHSAISDYAEALAKHTEALTELAQRLQEFTTPAQPKPDEREIERGQVTTKLWNIMAMLRDEGRLPDFRPSSIRRIPQHVWLREPYIGRKSLAELVHLCGNW